MQKADFSIANWICQTRFKLVEPRQGDDLRRVKQLLNEPLPAVPTVTQQPALPPGPPLPDHSVYGVRTLEGCSQVQLQTLGFEVKLQQQAHQLGLWQWSKGCKSVAVPKTASAKQSLQAWILWVPRMQTTISHALIDPFLQELHFQMQRQPFSTSSL